MRNWDWDLLCPGLIIIGLIGLLVAVLWHMDISNQKEQSKFMQACMKDKKEYECTAMWRAGESKSNTTVIPMPVVVGK